MANNSVKNSTGPKSQKKLRDPYAENDRPYVRGPVDDLRRNDMTPDEQEALKALIESEASGSMRPRRSLSPEEMSELEATARPDNRENPYGREGDYPQWPPVELPDGTRGMHPDLMPRQHDIEAGVVRGPLQGNMRRPGTLPAEILTTPELIDQFRGKWL